MFLHVLLCFTVIGFDGLNMSVLMMPRVTLCRAGAQVEDVRTPSLERAVACWGACVQWTA